MGGQEERKFPRGSGGCVLYPGTKVMIHSLKANKELNGQEAVCETWDAANNRMHIKLQDGKVKALRTKNMRKLHAEEEKEQDPQMQRVLEIFQKYDTNGDGIIDNVEFKKCLASLGLGESCLTTFLHSVDKGGDGEIQYEEFVTWAMGAGNAKSKKSRMDIFWPEAKDEAEKVGADDEDIDEDQELTLEDVERLCGELPDGWPDHGLTILNNMRLRFPGYPVEGIVWRMRRNNFIGGKVIAAIRATGATEVEVVPATAVKVGVGCFPHTYQVRSDEKSLSIFQQGTKDWSFQNMRDNKIQPIGSLPPRSKFTVLEVKRGSERGFCFGRIEHDGKPQHCWVVLGLEVLVSHFTTGNHGLEAQDLNYTEAERML